MKYAVIYQSKSGNTEMIACRIYDMLDTDKKVIINIDNGSQIPDADVYYVGFGVHNNSCSMDVEKVLRSIRKGKVALFATCGFMPEDTYKELIEKEVKEKLTEQTHYLGMFLCQGKVENDRKNIMVYKMPHSEKKLKEIFRVASVHPDENDLEAVSRFVDKLKDF